MTNYDGREATGNKSCVARAMRKSVEKWMKEEGGGVREEVDFACHFVSSTTNPKA